MTELVSAVRGMNDILPSETPLWQAFERAFCAVMVRYAYAEIRLPILEKTALFKRAIGDVTDIVEKEMYTFADRNGDMLSLRPEGTAQCIRAVLNHGLLHHQTPRLWYMGPMFRYERPQKGRYRQFYQAGAEALGMVTPEVDAEMIALTAALWKDLGISSQVTLHLNSLGVPAVRAVHRAQLVAYFSEHSDQLDEDSQRRLNTNPLRILDSKNPAMQDLIAAAPQLLDALDDISRVHFEGVCAHLDRIGIPYVLNPRLVRGLDYYTQTVFEWVTEALGAQGAVCGGGRYDGLLTELGAKEPTGAMGFSIGIERVLALMALAQPAVTAPCDVYVMALDDTARAQSVVLLEQWRRAVPASRWCLDCTGGSLKNQLKRADKSGAALAVIISQEALVMQQVQIKFLREDRPQVNVAIDSVATYF